MKYVKKLLTMGNPYESKVIFTYLTSSGKSALLTMAQLVRLSSSVVHLVALIRYKLSRNKNLY